MRASHSIPASFMVLVAFTVPAAATAPHHELEVRLDPAGHRIDVVDRITAGDEVRADADGAYRFLLHGGLTPEVATEGWRLERIPGEVEADFLGLNATTDTLADDVPLEGWRLVPETTGPAWPVELRYGGVLHHPITTAGEEYQRSFSETPGLVDGQGVFLAGTSFWVPSFGDQLVTFDLVVEDLEAPWDVVSQGRRVRHQTAPDGRRSTAWSCPHPTEEIYLVAGPWQEYADTASDVEVLAFLRSDDPALAQRYLAATRRYLKLYESMLPPYPYASFALVENFWETGYGMPGFTLLGPRVIRFPWILTSSYPHELLHNWWGNSAYPDYDRGNWCEGLTAYMADHLFAEQRGEGATYRRATLQKFTDFVTSGRDFPLVDFTSRRSAASEAVGYGKSLMLYHMIRRAVGDETFLAALSGFYERFRFRRSTFADIAEVLTESTAGEWGPFVAAWTGRTGAPRLELDRVHVRRALRAEEPWQLEVVVDQVQEEEPFPVTVPVAITLEGRDDPMWVESGTCGRTCTIKIPCPSRPLRVAVDPAFDVMRRLDPREVPPALSTLFGADAPLFVLPADAPEEERSAWRDLATAWARPGEPRIVLDSEISEVPAGPVWLLGSTNELAPSVLEAVARHDVALGADEIRLGGEAIPLADHSVVLVARGPHDPADAVGWVRADPVAAIPGLARKLPHYTRYSSLAFRGPEPENVAKGVWEATDSPLVRALFDDVEVPPLVLPARPPLAALPPLVDPDVLRGIVEHLAAPELEGRGLGSTGLASATDWVEARMRAAGLEPAGDHGFRQTWTWTGGSPEREMELVNLVGRVPGSDPELASDPVLVLAHLDHLGRGWPDVREGNEGQVHPGADDNASGVAALLETAALMASEPARFRPVLFAVVTGEEAGRLGSSRLLDSLDPGDLPFACVNLDTVGRLGDGRILVLDADSAREWRFVFMGVGYTTGAPIEVVTERLDSSDQTSCLEHGVPAVQLFTGPNADYHRPSDTADTIDAEGLAQVVEATHEAVGYLAERADPLTVTISGRAEEAEPEARGGARRASLGTMPDFGYSGAGVLLQQVLPDSPAAAAGLAPGDVVVAFDGAPIDDLRAYSAALKAHTPGDEVTITVRRDGEEVTVTATLAAR